MFDRLFKPSWQHANPEVRLAAIPRLAVDDPALSALARDTDTRVSKSAIERLADLALLISLAQEGTAAATDRLACWLNGSIQIEGAERQSFILAASTTLRAQLLPLLVDATLFADWLKVADPHLQAQLARTAATPALRELAAQEITDVTELRRLAREGRDKKIVQFARDALKKLQEESEQEATRQQQIQALLEQLRQLTAHTQDPLYVARLSHLEGQWQDIESCANGAQKAEAIQQLTQAKAKASALEQERSAQLAAQVLTLCARDYQELLSALAASGWEKTQEALAQRFVELDQRWQQNIITLPPTAEQLQRREQALTRWQIALALLAEFSSRSETSLDDRQTLLARWPDGVAMPATLTLPTAVAAAPTVDAKEKHTSKTRHKPAQAGLLHALRQALAQRQLKEANRIWQRLANALQDKPDSLAAQQMETLKAQLNELRDWHAFAANPKKESLCERMEALVTTPLAHPEEQANAIQALHDEWHALMSANQDADQTLWARFKQASDAAYDICRGYFQALDAQRAAMLQKRQELATQIETYLVSLSSENLDAASLWQIRRQAPDGWKKLSPVRFTDAHDVNQRFHRLLKQMDERLNDVSDAHQPMLETLLGKLEALTQTEDVEAATQTATVLQKEWRSVGWVHPQHYRKLEKRKRQLCDAIFNRRQQQQAIEHEQQQQLVNALQQELDQLKILLGTPADKDHELDAAIRQLKAKEMPAGAPALQQRKQTLLRQADQLRSQRQRNKHWQNWHDLLINAPSTAASPALRELCVALETRSGCPSPADAKEERLVWQMNTLARSMKTKLAPTEACQQLLEESRELIMQGLDEQSRERLLTVIAALTQGKA